MALPFVAVPYLFTAFVLYDLDASHWSGWARAWCGVFTVVFLCAAGAAIGIIVYAQQAIQEGAKTMKELNELGYTSLNQR